MISSIRTLPTVELILACLLWGFSYVATVWVLTAIDPFQLTATRFLIAFLSLLPVMLIFYRTHLSRALLQASLPGIFLGLTLVFQTWGLVYTTAVKSSFITSFYILLVPIFESKILNKQPAPYHRFLMAVGFLGLCLICDLTNLANKSAFLNINRGDFLTLLCTVFVSLQIIWLSKVDRSIPSFCINTFQCFWAGLAALPFLFFFAVPLNFTIPSPKVLWAFLILVFGCTVVAFALQVKAQKKLSPSTASIIFLLEAPLAALFALTLLSEHLSAQQWLGAGILFIVVFLRHTLPETPLYLSDDKFVKNL